MENGKTNKKPSLLIVEDDEENQKFLRFLLSRSFEVELCSNDVDFYSKLKEKQYDVLLMDISLKGSKNGLELIRELRTKNEYKFLPIACLTAHAFNKDRENAELAGADLYLTKPLPNQLLIESLLNLLNKKTKIY
jgi:CheY-like chemotaxis protein